eukprot:TRINITY_DN970_c0_g1_i1.p1 TRINITY_DN970_c0_g1~~TRINITY_DN970_c0_g1_i1.p1  ORF type:complete len:393 (-),score=34.35 TRINITY_DN970_c0_g1_i1:52-1230(-)
MKSAKQATLLIGLLLAVTAVWGSTRTGWSADTIPNPMKYPQLCGCGTQPSHVCDPDTLLSDTAKQSLHDRINFIEKNTTHECGPQLRGYQVAVVIVSQLEETLHETTQERTEAVARRIHQSWGVGHFPCDNGVVFLLSKNDRYAYISTGRGARRRLNDRMATQIIGSVKSQLRSGDYDGAVLAVVEQMFQAFSGELKEEADYSWIVVLGVIALFVTIVYYGTKKARLQADCRRKLTQIEQEHAEALAAKYEAKTCPICLEKFAKETTILRCGHKYCASCISKWSGGCPICREGATERQNHTDPNTSSSTLMQDRLLHFRLMQLHRQYPTYVTPSMVDRWSSPAYSGGFCTDAAFASSCPPPSASSSHSSSSSSSSSWGGGGCSGGGGGGGGW